jgi:hypothetical protein
MRDTLYDYPKHPSLIMYIHHPQSGEWLKLHMNHSDWELFIVGDDGGGKTTGFHHAMCVTNEHLLI